MGGGTQLVGAETPGNVVAGLVYQVTGTSLAAEIPSQMLTNTRSFSTYPKEVANKKVESRREAVRGSLRPMNHRDGDGRGHTAPGCIGAFMRSPPCVASRPMPCNQVDVIQERGLGKVI